MIQFAVKLDQGQVKKIPSSYPKLAKYESEFMILIDGRVFFDEPNFPVLEFLKYAIKWKEHADFSFEYCSIETEENPLIVFSPMNENWVISSPWQKFTCQTLFTTKELICAIDALLDKVISSK